MCCVGSVRIQIEIKKVGVLSIWIVKSNVLSVGASSERNMDEDPTLGTLEFTFHIGSTTTVLYFDLYLLYSAYAAHYVYI